MFRDSCTLQKLHFTIGRRTVARRILKLDESGFVQFQVFGNALTCDFEGVVRIVGPPETPMGHSFLSFVLLLSMCASLSAQWLHYLTPGIPRMPDGKPDLSAPAPKTAD